MVKEIPLTDGYVALVDDEDYERVMRHRWHAEIERRPGKGRPDVVYARRSINCGKYPDGRQKIRGERLHHFILGTRERTDHIDLNGLNNQKANLRVVTSSQNGANRRKKLTSASRFKGLSIVAGRGIWRARIQVNGQYRHLGYFHNEEEAARAYDRAAAEAFGEFALLNFPEELAA